MATFDSSTALKATSPATLLDRAYLPGVGSTTSLVKELVSGTEFTFGLQGSATRSSDADGNYLNSASSGQFATITETLDPGGDDFTAIATVKLATVNPGAWAGIYAWLVSGGATAGEIARWDTTGDLFVGVDGAGAQVTGAIANLSTNLLTIVQRYSNASGGKLFISSAASSTGNASGLSIPTGAINLIRLFNTAGLDGSWTGNMYFFALAGNATISDADCQAIADDVAGTLFATAGGGSSIVPILMNRRRMMVG